MQSGITILNEGSNYNKGEVMLKFSIGDLGISLIRWYDLAEFVQSCDKIELTWRQTSAKVHDKFPDLRKKIARGDQIDGMMLRNTFC